MKVIMITGASAGVGRAITLAFARKGASLGLIARSEKALHDVKAEVEEAGGNAIVLPLDVSDAQAVDDAAEKLEQACGPIDVWINCATVSVFSRFEDMTPEEYRRVTDVAHHGYVYGTMSALKRMKRLNRGTIIQIGSALSYRSIPLQSAYCAAKHAIRGFTDAIRSELIHQGSSIEISMIQLPAFNTPQFAWSRLHIDKEPQPLPPIYAPELAATAVVWAAENPQREVWVGLPTWKAIIGHKIFPGFLDRYMAKKAWEGQMTDKAAKPNRKDNLYESVEGVHAEKGSFTNREITEKPALWQVQNQNFWINGAACLLLFLTFLFGVLVG